MSSLRAGSASGSIRSDEAMSPAARDIAVATSQTTRLPPSIRSPVKTRSARIDRISALPLPARASGNT